MICFDCKKEFFDWKLLMEHKKIKHSKERKAMICFKCNKQFTCWQALVGHRNTDHPDRQSRQRFSCYWCEATFSTYRMSNRHTTLSHAFNCDQCMKKLLTWEEFKKHAKHCQFSRDHYEEFATRYGFELEENYGISST